MKTACAESGVLKFNDSDKIKKESDKEKSDFCCSFAPEIIVKINE